MAYKKGDLTVHLGPDFPNPDPDPDDAHYDSTGYDARGDRVPYPYVSLPHSCDGWVIGGAECIERLIIDLLDAKSKMSSS